MDKQNEEILRRDAESMRSHNFSEAYIETVTENTSKWLSTGLLTGVGSPYVARQMACILENQRLLNENTDLEAVRMGIPAGAQTANLEHWMSQVKRISIPAVRRVFNPKTFIGYDLVSVQVMNGPTDEIYFTNSYDRQIAESVVAKTRKLRATWDQYMIETVQETHSLDQEAEAVANYAKAIQDEINREIVLDLRNNAGKKVKEEWQSPEKVLEWIDSLSSYISTKTGGREGTWVVMGSQVLDAIQELEEVDIEGRAENDIRRVGKLARPNKSHWDLFEMNLPSTQVLIGHKNEGNHYASGYFYAPYAPLTCKPWWGLPDGSHGHGSTLVRYGKKMMRDGANYYALLDVDNIPVEQTESEEE
jgi:hypothetical protein